MGKLMDIKEIRRKNLRQLIDTIGGGKQSHLGSLSDTDPSLFSQILNRTRNMGEELARKIERNLGLSYGSMDRPATEDERGHYNAGTVVFISDLEPGEVGPRAPGMVPVVSWESAGDPAFAADQLAPGDALDWKFCNTKHSPQAYALIVEGDSMTAPYGRLSFPSGSLIFVDPEQRGGMTAGDPIIAKVNGEDAVTFKALGRDGGRVFLRPLNPQYPVITEPFRILGKVIEQQTSHVDQGDN